MSERIGRPFGHPAAADEGEASPDEPSRRLVPLSGRSVNNAMDRRRLPSLTALKAFEAYARHASMTAAAKELGTYPGGVSRHVRGLEAELGVSLATGSRRGVYPTAEGEALAKVLTRAFDLISEALPSASPSKAQAPGPSPAGADEAQAAEG